MTIEMEACRILGIGNLHNFIFVDNANRKRHVVFFGAAVKEGTGCDLYYIALTLNEYKQSKYSVERIPKVLLEELSLGEVKITGKTKEVCVINDGVLETLRITNSILKRAICRGNKLQEKINGVFDRNEKDFIVKYLGETRGNIRRILHINSKSPKFSIAYYPENPRIGLYDRSLNSRGAFPTAGVLLIESDNYDDILNYIKCGKRFKKKVSLWCKLICFIKNIFK